MLRRESLEITNAIFFCLEIKWDVLKQVERLANPLWMKQARQTLLHYKQQNPQVYQDLCLFSEVSRMLSDSTYRLGPRRLLQELFLEVNCDTFYAECDSILAQGTKHSLSSNCSCQKSIFIVRR